MLTTSMGTISYKWLALNVIVESMVCTGEVAVRE